MLKRVVLDTSVVVAALRSRTGAANVVLRLVATGRLTLLATPPLFLEYEDVLKRPERRLEHGLSLEGVDEFLSELAALIEPVEVHYLWRPQLRDPNDKWFWKPPFTDGMKFLREAPRRAPGAEDSERP